jgi:uroporphyrinogen-III synthase
MTLAEVEEYGRLMGLKIKAVVTGPLLRLEAAPLVDAEFSSPIGYLTAFIRPVPFKLFHLDTIQVKNRRQNLGFNRAQLGYTIDGPGISFVMGSYALAWALERGCTTTQLLAVKDSEEMHNVLVRMYESYGFNVVRSVGDESSSIADRLVWGAVGTLMQMDIPTFMREWSPKLRSLSKLAKLKASMEGASPSLSPAPTTTSSSSTTSSISISSSSKPRRPLVALTREAGANDKLAALLPASEVECVEIPCIAFGPGEDSPSLSAALTKYDSIILTSPQAAVVFLAAWQEAGKPKVRLATVGKGTSKPLKAAGLEPVFEPSDSTAETLAKELPLSLGPKVLYPSSAIAENTLVKGLEARGLSVTRLSTYDTVPATWTEEQLRLAKSVDLVTFASPSTVRVWAERVGTTQQAVVIGPTSAKACRSAGWEEDCIACPEGSKGIEAWASLTLKAAAEGLVAK